MAKEDLVEGLRLAVSKGESLKSAMMSFYNAGYAREDIEDAARTLQAPQFAQLSQTKPVQVQKPTGQKIPPVQQQNQKFQSLTPSNIQKVSNYDKVSGSGNGPSKAPIIFLIVILFLLFGALIGIFLFRSQLTSLFNNLIG